uniref:Ig-like domain-containing protein n=1 Tax=Oryzias latipes TaxID=8090 RepID=A0A3B3IB24_ORYLA
MLGDQATVFYEPESSTVIRGLVAVLDCEFGGSEPFKGFLSSLEIHPFESVDAGEYECTIANDVGSMTSKSVVRQKGHVTAGNSATLENTITGSPELSVKWFKDGKEIISGHKYKVKLKEHSALLKILTSEQGDTGDYTMVVSNKVGQDKCTSSVTVIAIKGLYCFPSALLSVFSLTFKVHFWPKHSWYL